MLTPILTIAIGSLLMVVAMVRFSASFIEQRPSAARWGLFYGLTWAALIWAFRRLIDESGADVAAAPLLVLVVAGWGTLHALWMWLALTGSPGRETSRRNAGVSGVAGLGIVAMAVARIASPALRFDALQPGPLALMILTAVLGVALLIAGGVRTAKHERDEREAFPRDEVEDELARRNAEAQPSLRGPRRPATVVMGVGAALTVTGAFGAAIVAGPLPVKLLCGAALAFAGFQVLRRLTRT